MKQIISDLYRNAMLAIDDGLMEGFLPEKDVDFIIEGALVVPA